MPFWLLFTGASLLGGLFFNWGAGRCKGRNAQRASRLAAWGMWLLLLWFVPLGWLGLVGRLLDIVAVVKLIPSILCFVAAAGNMLKEVRAQQQGDYTDPAL